MSANNIEPLATPIYLYEWWVRNRPAKDAPGGVLDDALLVDLMVETANDLLYPRLSEACGVPPGAESNMLASGSVTGPDAGEIPRPVILFKAPEGSPVEDFSAEIYCLDTGWFGEVRGADGVALDPPLRGLLSGAAPRSFSGLRLEDAYAVLLALASGARRRAEEENTPPELERTLREEGWMLSNELHEGEEPMLVAAFRALQEEDWTKFVDDTTDNPGLKFYNRFSSEYSPASSWGRLSADTGIAPLGDEWALPPDLTDRSAKLALGVRRILTRFGATPPPALGFAPPNVFPSWIRGATFRGNTIVLMVRKSDSIEAVFFGGGCREMEALMEGYGLRVNAGERGGREYICITEAP